MWSELTGLAHERTLSILLTTHYLEEADRLADRIVIISHGRVIAEGTPEALKAGLAGDSVSIVLAGSPAADMVMAAATVGARAVTLDGNLLRARVEHGNQALPAILSRLAAAGCQIESASVARPTLDDVYLTTRAAASPWMTMPPVERRWLDDRPTARPCCATRAQLPIAAQAADLARDNARPANRVAPSL